MKYDSVLDTSLTPIPQIELSTDTPASKGKETAADSSKYLLS